jgi:hypothetical protein
MGNYNSFLKFFQQYLSNDNSCFKYTSVACAIGPSVNTFFIFQIFRIENLKIWQHSKIEGPTDFSFQTQIFQFFKFPATKSAQKSISSTLQVWKLWNKLY